LYYLSDLRKEVKQFWNILRYFLSVASGIAIIGSVYLFVDSIKNKPLPESKVREIVQQEINPLSEIVFKTYISVTALDSATVRTLTGMPKNKVLLLFYKDLMFTKPLDTIKKETPKYIPKAKIEKIKK
jgi:hypothetical protein